MSFITKYAERAKAEYMSHVRPVFTEWLAERESVSHSAFHDFCLQHGMNSYERELMYPKLDDDALIRVVERCLENCQSPRKRPCSTYNESLENIFAPMLIERLRKAVPE